MTVKHLSRRILADNVQRMIEKRGVSLRAWALSHKLQQKAIDRIVKAEYATTIDTLDLLADRLGIQAWQLLVPNMRLDELPTLQFSKEERDLYERIRTLAAGLKKQ